MKKILYLHGLESKQGGEKVDYLSSQTLTIAPVLDYKREDIFEYLDKLVKEVKPDVIIGSSMGGYAAFVLGSSYSIPVIAYNPAIQNREFDKKLPPSLRYGLPQELLVVLGKEDKVVNPTQTIQDIEDRQDYYGMLENIEIKVIEGMGHRVDFSVFVDIYNYKIK